MAARKDNRALLREVIDRHELTYAQVAELTRTSRDTVESWLRPATSKSHRGMPDGLLELLYLKLGEESPF